jgi:hypothetical protein
VPAKDSHLAVPLAVPAAAQRTEPRVAKEPARELQPPQLECALGHRCKLLKRLADALVFLVGWALAGRGIALLAFSVRGGGCRLGRGLW